MLIIITLAPGAPERPGKPCSKRMQLFQTPQNNLSRALSAQKILTSEPRAPGSPGGPVFPGMPEYP